MDMDWMVVAVIGGVGLVFLAKLAQSLYLHFHVGMSWSDSFDNFDFGGDGDGGDGGDGGD